LQIVDIGFQIASRLATLIFVFPLKTARRPNRAAWVDAGAKWAATDEGKQEMKKVHDAEKELDQAKDAWKPFEKCEDKKAASNP
jgi:hypothetical protein